MLKRIKATLATFIKYIPLLQHLVSRDLKLKYRRSFLGYVWSILNPLMIMIVLTIVFSNMFQRNIANYPVYLFSGRMLFSFMTESTNSAMRAITDNGSLLKKTYLPKYIFPLANVSSSAMNFLFSLGAFFLVLIATGTRISLHILFFPLVVVQIYVFCLGMGFFLAQANVFFRDTSHLYSVFTTAWMYLTPLFYPMESLSEGLAWGITHFNPLYFYIQQTRMIFLQNVLPSADLVLRGGLTAVVLLALGLLSFYKTQDKFILYI